MNNNYFQLQQFCWPDTQLITETELYAKETRNSILHLNAAGASFCQNGKMSFDTFFNSLTVDVWKKYCNCINNVALRLKGNTVTTLNETRHELVALFNRKSWRVAKPLRLFTRMIKKVLGK